MFPVNTTTFNGKIFSSEINHIEFQFVTKREFKTLLSLAKSSNLPVIHHEYLNNINMIPKPNRGAIIYFQGNRMVVIAYIEEGSKPFNHIQNNNYDQFISFIWLNDGANEAMLYSIAGAPEKWGATLSWMPNGICSQYFNCEKLSTKIFQK